MLHSLNKLIFYINSIKIEPEDDQKPEDTSDDIIMADSEITIKNEDKQSPEPQSPISESAISLLTEKLMTPKEQESKYCEKCDIKFNFMNTFIAHKQYYCKNSTNINADIIEQYSTSNSSSTNQVIVTKATETVTPVL